VEEEEWKACITFCMRGCLRLDRRARGDISRTAPFQGWMWIISMMPCNHSVRESALSDLPHLANLKRKYMRYFWSNFQPLVGLLYLCNAKCSVCFLVRSFSFSHTYSYSSSIKIICMIWCFLFCLAILFQHFTPISS
jgi:hypothetical protein